MTTPSTTSSESSKKPTLAVTWKRSNSTKGSVGSPLLLVPSPLLTSDNTPTPVRTLIRDFEANSLPFSDLKANPFDEHFRKAAEINKKTLDQDSDSLNTPILAPDINIHSSKFTQIVQVPQGPSAGLPSVASFVPIAPAQPADPAQLLIKLPSGQAIQLAEVPVVSPAANASVLPLKRAKRVALQVESDHDELRKDLLERNRMAAQRSREKKKRLGEKTQTQLKQALADNQTLVKENEALKLEIVRLKQLLHDHAPSVTC